MNFRKSGLRVSLIFKNIGPLKMVSSRNDGHGLFLTTEKNYGDFELQLEYKTVAGADSGIYLRGVPQIQIWDTTKDGGKWKLGADKGSGGLWNNGPAGSPGRDPLVKADKPFGEWNKFHITMRGNLVTVLLNDKLVVDEAPLINYWDRKLLSKKGNHLEAWVPSNYRPMVAKYAGETYISKNYP